MKLLKYIFIIFILANRLAVSQSTVDISYGTEINLQAGTEICADQQTGDGLLSGEGYFCGGTLPVELESFTYTLNGNDVTLNWATSSEENNSGFNVERKKLNDAGNWQTLGFVMGNGTVQGQSHYSFADHHLLTGKYTYRLKQTDYNGNYQYFQLNGEVSIGTPDKYYLSQNYPNPFNPSTTIQYDLPFDSKVSIRIFDISGKEVGALVDKVQAAGSYEVNITSSAFSLTSGTYFYRINAESNGNKFVATKKMMLVK